jgi:1,2-dihydroxy-3-keto-5-methylthiopentene dioxygenase
MAILRLPDEGVTYEETSDVARILEGVGIDFARVTLAPEVASASADGVLAACENEIAALKERGGYVTADVIDVNESTPGLDEMLARFRSEHWHDEDEVRLIVSGRGVFHVRAKDAARVVAIEVEAGDMIRVPAGTLHWFDLCSPRAIRAVRLFRDRAGWAPRYTESGAERGYQPVCLGPPAGRLFL